MHKLAFALAALLAALVATPMAATWSANSATTNTSSRCDVIADSSAVIGGANGLTAAQRGVARTIWLRANAHPDQIPPNLADQAATIAIAVASQESSLGANPASRTPNSDGDAGIFQQRTLPGWYGTVAQVSDPTYGADTFLLGHTVTAPQYVAAQQAGVRPAGPAGYHLPGLVDVPNWSRLDLVDAAQAVQRSADPNAITDDIPLARRLVADFDSTEQTATAVSVNTGSQTCGGTTECPPTGLSAETGLQPDTLLVLRCVHQHFGKITAFYGVRPDPLPDHPSGLAVDIMISSAFPDYNSPAAVAYGHAIAAWLQAHHTQLGVHYLIYRQHIWNVDRADEGWRPMPDRGSPTANHMDHVHVTTYGHAATGLTSAVADSGPDQAVTPVERYTITARFGQVGPWARYHTGLDFAAPIGTPVRAALTGVVTHAGYGPAALWAGNYVTIRHADGTSTLYAHMERHDARVGQTVTTGQQIGAIGVTGRSFGPHLHFEVYPESVEPGDVYRAIDPVKWLRSRGASVVLGKGK